MASHQRITFRCPILLLLFLGCNLFISAQGVGRVFRAPGVISNGDANFVLHFGGGGEALIVGGFGIAADIGYLFDPDAFGDGLGAFSSGGIFKFNRDERTVPFVTAGYTLLFRESTLSFGYVGVGVNRWFGDHFGLRVEAKDHFRDRVNVFETRFEFLIR